jgi:uncharacterized membrane-anchored protein YitT (DUF2179 family)
MIGGLWTGVALGILAKMNASLGGGSLLGENAIFSDAHDL